MKSQTSRLLNVSYIRATAMLLIVLYHSFCYTAGVWHFNDSVNADYGLWFPMSVYTGLGLFVFISGYLYGYMVLVKGKYTKLWPFVLNKVKRLIVPYLIWNVLIVLLLPFNPSVKEFVIVVLKKGYIHLWFLLMLFKIFMVVLVLKPLWMRSRLWHDVCIIIVLLLINATHLPMTGSLSDLAIFYSGIVVTKHREHLPDNVNVWFFLLASALYVVSFVIGIPTLKQIALLLFAYSLLKYLDSVFESRSFEKMNDIVGFFDKHSMGVYIVHHIVIFQLLFYYAPSHSYLNAYPVSGPLILFVGVTAVSLMLSWIIEKIHLSKILFG